MHQKGGELVDKREVMYVVEYVVLFYNYRRTHLFLATVVKCLVHSLCLCFNRFDKDGYYACDSIVSDFFLLKIWIPLTICTYNS